MSKRVFLLGVMGLSVLTWSSARLLAGTTGKIAGRIYDKATGEPLPGANIIIEGTLLGAASDIEGHYVILQVPPGTFNVQASMLGYAVLTVANIQVEIDQTARVEFGMQEQALVGQEVTVVAEQKMVKRDVSASVTSISAKSVQEVPLTTVTEVLELQAGVDDGLVIRGGGADEALFVVDGFALRDARNNQPITGVPLSTVQNVSLERGGFSAEYGQVRSGVVNVVTKDGSKSGYSGTMLLKYSAPGQKHFGVSPFDPNSVWLRPYLDPDVAFVGTANGSWDEFTQRQYPTFDGWNAVSERLLSNDNPDDDLTPAAAQRLFQWQHRKQEVTDQPDYDIDAGFGGPVPFIGKSLGDLRFFAGVRQKREMLMVPLTRDDYRDYDYTLRLTSDISPTMKLHLSGFLGKSYNVAVNGTEQNFSNEYIRFPSQIADNIDQFPFTSSARVFSNSYYSLAEVAHTGISAELTHLLGQNTFYEARIDYFQRDYEAGPSAERDPNSQFPIVPGFFANGAPFGWSPLPDVGIGDGILFGGHTSTARDSSKTSFVKLKFDLTSQVNFNNEIKAGLELVASDLNLNYGVYNITFPESNTRVKQNWSPLQAGVYIQDKIEFKGFIADVGLRLDYADAQTDWVRANFFDKSFFGNAFNPSGEFNKKSSKAQWSLSPRLGISHPITDNSKLWFNYGHFKQLPTYEQLFRISRNPAGRLTNYGDPNLDYAKTISYELGYDQSFYDNYLVQLSGYYRDITNQQDFTTFQSADGGVNVTAANNDSYEDIRGFEVSLRKSRGDWFTGFATYTYQVNTLGRFGKDNIFEDPLQQRDFDSNIGNFAQNKPLPQPRANAVLSFFSPEKFGPDLLGVNPLGNWSLTLLSEWIGGWYATWNPNRIQGAQQNLKTKDWYNFDLRLTKDFKVGPMKTQFLVDVSNLFNTRRLAFNAVTLQDQSQVYSYVSFYDVNDQLDYFRSLHLPESSAYNNIVGDDKPGDFRDSGVAFQPIIQLNSVDGLTSAPRGTRPFYYETSTGRYMQFANGGWTEVPGARLKQVLDGKAYIDMPNLSSFRFLNPRDIFVGVRTSFEF